LINIDDIKAGYTLGHADAEILRSMAREIQAYRQAFSEPEAYATSDGRMLIFADSPNMLPEDKSNLTPLYRKPTIPE